MTSDNRHEKRFPSCSAADAAAEQGVVASRFQHVSAEHVRKCVPSATAQAKILCIYRKRRRGPMIGPACCFDWCRAQSVDCAERLLCSANSKLLLAVRLTPRPRVSSALVRSGYASWTHFVASISRALKQLLRFRSDTKIADCWRKASTQGQQETRQRDGGGSGQDRRSDGS